MDYLIDLEFEMKSLSDRLEIINNYINSIEKSIKDDQIKVGSRVKILTVDPQVEGRVWKILPDGTIYVNRDGYQSHMKFKLDELENLSVGTYGKMEREKWIINDRINKIKSLFPNLLDIETCHKIIESQYFIAWYNENGYQKHIELKKLIKLPEVFIKGVILNFNNTHETTLTKLLKKGDIQL